MMKENDGRSENTELTSPKSESVPNAVQGKETAVMDTQPSPDVAKTDPDTTGQSETDKMLEEYERFRETRY